MDKQPEALRLADDLESSRSDDKIEAANVIRRQHSLIAELVAALEKRSAVDAAYAKLAMMDVSAQKHEQLMQAIEDAEEAACDFAKAALSKAKEQ